MAADARSPSVTGPGPLPSWRAKLLPELRGARFGIGGLGATGRARSLFVDLAAPPSSPRRSGSGAVPRGPGGLPRHGGRRARVRSAAGRSVHRRRRAGRVRRPVAHDDDAAARRSARRSPSCGHAERLGDELGLPMPLGPGARRHQHRPGRGRHQRGPQHRDRGRGEPRRAAAAGGRARRGPGRRDDAASSPATPSSSGRARTIEAKGFERARCARGRSLGLRPGAHRRWIPLVDRRRELALLGDTFDAGRDARARAPRDPARASRASARAGWWRSSSPGCPEGTKVLTGRSSPFEEESTFWPVAQMIHRELGEDARRRAPRRPGGAASRRDRVGRPRRRRGGGARLGLALGLQRDGEEESRYQRRRGATGRAHDARRARAHAARSCSCSRTCTRPIPLLLDLIEQLVKEARKVPLMVVCVARWEFLEERPGWAGGIADAVTLWVEPLTPDHATAARDRGRRARRRGEAERIAVHAGGNPFFIIETTGMLLHEERTERPPARATPRSRLLPATVQAVIAARIDQLSPAARELVRRASVFPRGRVRPRRAVADRRAHARAARGGRGGGVPAARTRSARRVAVPAATSCATSRTSGSPSASASGCTCAWRTGSRSRRRPSATRGRSRSTSSRRRGRRWTSTRRTARSGRARGARRSTHAGDLARRRIESRAAVDLYERALALAGPETGWGEREAWILSLLGEARYWLGEFDDAEARFRKALALAEGERARHARTPRGSSPTSR